MLAVIKPLKLAVFAALLGASAAGHAATVTVVVASTAGPWSVAVNPDYSYGTDGATAPGSVSSGFSFAAGGAFSFTATGTVAAFGGGTMYGPTGDPGYDASANGGSSGNGFPSRFVNPSQYPAYLAALIGTFADASGAIVGTPFVVGDSYSLAAPSGATQLLFGINDDIFGDNSGSFSVTVTGPNAVGPIPEPATWALLVGGFGVAGGAMRRRVRSARAFA